MRNGRRMPGPRRIDGHKVWDVRELDLCFDDFPRADAFDYHCPLLSLPLALQATLETILAESQYLRAARDCELLGRPPKTKPRIGLVWSGSTVFLTTDADWICLQKDIREKGVAVLRQDGRIAFFGDDLRDFSDTVALLDLMDRVVTIDTSVAHLAGAMGKPVGAGH